jgi:hypothetical protein
VSVSSFIPAAEQKELIDGKYYLGLDCRYIDCGKHVDDRLNVLKSNFTEWFDDAAWHSPSVLVLDDLDQLLPAEPEVKKKIINHKCTFGSWVNDPGSILIIKAYRFISVSTSS